MKAHKEEIKVFTFRDGWKTREYKKCPKCDSDEKLSYLGSQDGSHGWSQYFECPNCKTKYQHMPCDMGQNICALTEVKF